MSCDRAAIAVATPVRRTTPGIKPPRYPSHHIYINTGTHLSHPCPVKAQIGVGGVFDPLHPVSPACMHKHEACVARHNTCIYKHHRRQARASTRDHKALSHASLGQTHLHVASKRLLGTLSSGRQIDSLNGNHKPNFNWSVLQVGNGAWQSKGS